MPEQNRLSPVPGGHNSPEDYIQSLLSCAPVRSVMEYLKEKDAETLAVQKELCAIPSPSNHEEARAARYFSMLSGIGLDEVRMDEAGNVIGLLRGAGTKNGTAARKTLPAVVLAAHMDTVFSADTDCTPVTKEGGLVWALGIGDDTRGMAEVYMIAKALCALGIRASRDILFVGDVGEESVGDLRGTRHLFASGLNIGAFLSIDGGKPESLVTNAIASCTYRFTFSGRGGHALSDFGVPNVNNAMARAAARIADMEVPEDPRTVFNIGVMRGGVSPNAIPSEAYMDVNLRSVDSGELDRICAYTETSVRDAVDAENAHWAYLDGKVTVEKTILTRRPGGVQSPDLPLVRTAVAAYRACGMEPQISKAASTDSNIPISLGI
ncbi:MAG: M20/M25/M40 family metallo-hydrolase, partial [Stomatobaculum sp.]|nr:M20/M25/M40 family metallo-hydrolase [Stomatobaculum sp.]